MTTSTEAPCADIATGSTVLYARTVAYMLEKHLQKCEDGSVHWATTAGDELPWEPAKLVWPDDPCLSYSIAQGTCEGSKVVICEESRLPYASHLTRRELLVIKFLRGAKRVCAELPEVIEWLESSLDIQACLEFQSKHKKLLNI